MKNSSHKKPYLKAAIYGMAIFLGGFLIGSVSLADNADCAAVQANVLANEVIAETPNTTDTPDAETTDQTTNKNIDIFDSTTTAFLGSEDAPVTMIEFTDYQCPYCQRYYFGAFKDIVEQYVKTGKVKYEMKSLPLPFHPAARPASYATHCAAEQNATWAMHKRLFMYQNEWAYDANPNQKFTDYALEIGLDSKAFSACLASAPKKYSAAIDADIAFAKGYKLTGTPSFLINGSPVVGAMPFESFSAIIEKAL